MTYPIQRALLSVSDKTHLLELARGLVALGIELISTGGTAKTLKDANLPVRSASELTQFPEIMGGRVKTLHPMIHGGILGKRDEHATEAKTHGIAWIDLVVCNLYPFADTIANHPDDLDLALENIDIGGPTMIRAAAKNFPWVGVVTDPNDYAALLDALREGKNTLSKPFRQQLASKAFAHTAAYDALITQHLCDSPFPNELTLTFKKQASLRYGENPHQDACLYQAPLASLDSLLQAHQHQGKALSYNNLADTDAALACITDFETPTCVVVKHATPCGIASHDDITLAFKHAFEADRLSAFGGIVALNRPCTLAIAQYLSAVFIEVLVAPGFTPEALALLKAKENLRVLELKASPTVQQTQHYKLIKGGLLLQGYDNKCLEPQQLTTPTQAMIPPTQLIDLQFAWQCVRHIKSNAIVIARDNQTVGIGGGQVSRVDAVAIAIEKAGKHCQGAVLASDAFFPFRDSIDKIAQAGITAIIQPGGSIRDDDVIAACNEQGIAMLFTGFRTFKH